ncbi:vesicle-associated protein 1-4-like isoform X2 [Durio zibethinus]|uniref:Vesicle-associated protein 1-4-like isoform X2 n=1 Tax=Durio zibethinus TaxID=66656 RepID=A0A6P5YCA5_DURZI|nr:vesicle-associated protein 1-4-like isoform X2 [Durio zibethinus]
MTYRKILLILELGVMTTLDSNQLISVHHNDLKFIVEPKKQSSGDLKVVNNTEHHVAFKVKTTAPKNYCVRPFRGVVLPWNSCVIRITRQAQQEYPPDMQCKDKFMLQSTIVPPNTKVQNLPADTFNKERAKEIEEYKLKVFFLSPSIQGNSKGEGLKSSTLQIPYSNSGVKIDLRGGVLVITAIDDNQLISVHPNDLKFIIEPKKQSSCDLKVVNNAEHHVAFKVNTTAPKNYCVRPNRGVVLPWNSCVIRITRQAQREYPPDMQCKDKFMLQSTIVSPNTNVHDLPADTFNKERGKKIQEYKLKVFFVSPSAQGNSKDEGLKSSTLQIPYSNSAVQHPKDARDAAVQLTLQLQQKLDFLKKRINNLVFHKLLRRPRQPRNE